MLWPRPVPTVGDRTTAAERAAYPQAWAMAPEDIDALHRVLVARRDVRRYRPDPVAPELLRRVLAAAHTAPSVGHSQPWRFVVVEDAMTRRQAATLADEQRLTQAAAMDEAAGRHLLDLDLEGIREAPVGIVVCCDRRAPPDGILGRATFADADLWSCACAIENLWLAARAEGLGVGWVTLFRPADLAGLVGAPDGVTTLGWLCLGWPDERPPAPGLERRGWSTRLPLDQVVLRERWPAADSPAPPVSRLAAPCGPSLPAIGGPGDSAVGALPAAVEAPPSPASVGALPSPASVGALPAAVVAPPSPASVGALPAAIVALPSPAAIVAARDDGDGLLTPPGSLGLLDVVVDRLAALGLGGASSGTLVIAAADHPVTGYGVSAYRREVTRQVVAAALAGEALGAVAARSAGLDVVVVDAGIDGPVIGGHPLRPTGRRGDLVTADALTADDCCHLVAEGRILGARLARHGLVALGEVGVGNTTVAAALAALSLNLPPEGVVGLGAGADRSILETKLAVVRAIVQRVGPGRAPLDLLAAAGGAEIAVLTGVVLGVTEAGGAVVLDGLATSVAALIALREAPAVAAHLVAGQRSREAGHGPVLAALGLEALLDLRIRAGEGAGAAFATGLVLAALRVRLGVARVAPRR